MMQTGMTFAPESTMLLTDSELLDSYLSYRRRYDLLQDDKDVNLDNYAKQVAICQDEYVNRGNPLEGLAFDASARMATLMGSNVDDLDSKSLNLRILYNTDNVVGAKLAAKALDQDPANVEASNEAAGGRKALEADVTIRSIDEMPQKEAQQASSVWQFIDQTVMSVGQSWLLSKVTGLFGGSPLLSSVVGIGGRQILNNTGIMPASIAPILELVKPLLPKQAQESVDHVIDALQPKTEEQLEQERVDAYNPVAIHDSMATAVLATGAVTSESLREAMRVNGEVIGANGIMAHAGTNVHDTDCVYEMVATSTTAAETAFDERLASGEDCSEDMHYYYMSLFEGLAGYNEGVLTGASSVYGEEDPQLGASVQGLGYTNGQYCSAAITSLRKYDEQYHFMTEEDWAKLDGYNFVGVGSLSTYIPEYSFPEETFEDPGVLVSEESVDGMSSSDEEDASEVPVIPKPDSKTFDTESDVQSVVRNDAFVMSDKERQTDVLQTPVSDDNKVQNSEDSVKKREERVRQAKELEDKVAGGSKDSGLNLNAGMSY